MQYCSGAPYGAFDMHNLVLTAPSHHMFSDGPAHYYSHHHYQQYQQHQQDQDHQQHYQDNVQQHELVDFYQREAASISEQQAQGTHLLFGLHSHQQLHQKFSSLDEPGSFNLTLPHHVSLSSECAPLASMNKMPITTGGHDLMPQCKPAEAVHDFGYSTTTASDAHQTAMIGSGWAREETEALLRIRSEMDPLFRDSSSSNSLWDEISRKLQNAGFQRTAIKCKEKFEDINKFWIKGKDGKSQHASSGLYHFNPGLGATFSTNEDQDSHAGRIMNKDNGEIFSSIDASAMLQLAGNTTLHDHDGSTGPDSPSSKSFGDGSEQQAFSRKRKRSSSSWRTMRAFFEDLTTQLIERQDAMHRKFLETMERREEERARREEAYKRQEMARMSREQDLRAREKALAATRDAALVAFLQKVTGETLHLPELGSQSIPVNLAAPMSTAAAAAAGTNEPVNTPSAEDPHDGMKDGAGDGNCRRWPKVEVLALIRVRTSLESRFQEAGPKAQLWEEVAASMASLGFTRSGKRCKEKWENINKYYRKTRDNVGRKLRPESATKTCPYFNELELLYERGVLPSPSNNKASTCRLEGPQMSGEFVETSSRDESQHTLDGGGSADYPSGSSCISNVVPISSNLETNFDGRNVMLEMAATSSVGINGSVQSGERAHDLDFGADKNLKSDSASILCLVDQINVNCRPSQYLSAVDRVHDGKLASHEQMAPNVSSGILGAASASRFVRDIIGFQQQQQPPYGSRHQLDSAHLRFKHEMPSMEPENPACDEQVSELRMKLQNEDQRPRAMDPQGRSQSENVNLMTLVHKLGTSSTPNGSCEFRELLSPASSSAQV